MMTAAAFQKKGSFTERLLWEISCACVDSKPVVIGLTPLSLCSQCKQQQPWRLPVNKARVFFCVFPNTINRAKLKAH